MNKLADGSLHVEFGLPGRNKRGRLLALGHFDTVWPVGTLKTMPFRRSRDRLWGPGAFDMKGGIAFFLFAMRALADLGIPVKRRVLLRSGDVVVLGGAARLAYHGIDRIHAGTSTLIAEGGRINLTLRRVRAAA